MCEEGLKQVCVARDQRRVEQKAEHVASGAEEAREQGVADYGQQWLVEHVQETETARLDIERKEIDLAVLVHSHAAVDDESVHVHKQDEQADGQIFDVPRAHDEVQGAEKVARKSNFELPNMNKNLSRSTAHQEMV